MTPHGWISNRRWVFANSTHRTAFVALSALLVGLLSLHGARMRAAADTGPGPSRTPTIATPTGPLPNDARKATSDLARLGRCIRLFKAQKHRYPTRTSDLLDDMARRAGTYRCKVADFMNPHSAFADSPQARRYPDKYFPFLLPGKRPDGNPVGSPHKEGLRDVLALTDIYAHKTVTHRPRGGDLVEPVGFYVVLWDDYQIQKIPKEDALYVPLGRRSFAVGFPGQAGLSPRSMTFWDFHRDSAHQPKADRRAY